MIILRDGSDWQGGSADTVSNFHEIARSQGSAALWLGESGLLVVPKASGEDKMTFPYDEWREQAAAKASEGPSTSARRPDTADGYH